MTCWRRARIGELVSVVGGGTPSKENSRYYGGSIPWVTPKDMKSWEIHGAQVGITEQGVAESAARVIPDNSVLVVVRSGILKHSLPVGITRVPAAINQDMKALLCGRQIDPVYLARFLQFASAEILSWVRATTADNFPIEKLKALELPLPPVPEQRRLADILDKADALRAKRCAALTTLDSLTQFIFLDMFGDPIANPNGWDDSVKLGDIAEIVSGITKGRKVASTPTRDVPYLAVINVQDKALNLTTVKNIEATDGEIQRYRLKRNDLLLTEGGDPDKLGRGTLWMGELPLCIYQNHIFRVRLTSGRIDPVYLSWLVGSSRGKKYFLKSAKQTTGIASINMTQLRGFPLLMPPISGQREFAQRVADVSKLRDRYVAGREALDALFASLQHRAFRGEL